jgi:hypothetical protein
MAELEHVLLSIGVAAAAISVVATLFALLKSRGGSASSEIILRTDGSVKSYEIPSDQAEVLRRMLEIEELAKKPPSQKRTAAHPI